MFILLVRITSKSLTYALMLLLVSIKVIKFLAKLSKPLNNIAKIVITTKVIKIQKKVAYSVIYTKAAKDLEYIQR